MIENTSHSSNYASFIKVSSSKSQFSKESQASFAQENNLKVQNLNLDPNSGNYSTIIHHAMSSPSVIEQSEDMILTDTDTDNEDDKSLNKKNNDTKTISSDPCISLSNNTRRTAPLFNCDDKNIDLHTAVQKRYSSLTMPVNMTNKMSIQRTRQMTFGGGKVNKNHLQKMNVYGKKIHVGLGFPTKAPVINNNKSKIIEMSDKSFNNLEDLIQKIKDENNNPKSTSQNDVEKDKANDIKQITNDETDELKNNNMKVHAKENPTITGQDISRVSTEIDSTKKQFIQMETNILSEFINIKSSINQLLEDRKEIQKQHRIWLETMKKKIYQTKKETKNIENKPLDSIYTK